MGRTLFNRWFYARRSCACGSPAATDAAREPFTGQITYLIGFAFILFCLFIVLVLSRSLSILLLVLPVLFNYSGLGSRDSIVSTPSALPNLAAMPKSIRRKSPDVASCPHECFRFRHSFRRHHIASFGRHHVDRRRMTPIDGRYAQWYERTRCDVDSVNHPRGCLFLDDLYNARERSYDDIPDQGETKKPEAFAERGCAIGFHSLNRSHRDEIIPSRNTNDGDLRKTPTESGQRACAMKFHSLNSK